MTELQFVGDDMRWLYETLIEACEITSREGKCPSVRVNGKVYTDLLKVAQIMPDEPLQAHHQIAANELFQKKQSGYRRTGSNLAHRSNQIRSNAQSHTVYMRQYKLNNTT